MNGETGDSVGSKKDKVDKAGIAICGECSTDTTVYITDNGLRCEDCISIEPDTPATYTPGLRDFEDTRGKEMAENVDNFMDNLADIGFDIELEDGSMYEMQVLHSHAVLTKYGDNWEEFVNELPSIVADHYNSKTEPTKFTDRAPWGAGNHDNSKEEYETHAELAKNVAYYHLRPAILQLGMVAATDEDEEAPTVIGIGDEEIHQYTTDGRITVPIDEDFSLGGDDE